MKCEDDVGQHAGPWCAREASQLSFDAADQDADYPPGEFAAGPLQPEPAAQAYDAQLSPYAADALADCGAHALAYDLPDRDDPMAPHEYAPLPGTAYIHGHYVPFRGDAPDAGSMSVSPAPHSLSFLPCAPKQADETRRRTHAVRGGPVVPVHGRPHAAYPRALAREPGLRPPRTVPRVPAPPQLHPRRRHHPRPAHPRPRRCLRVAVLPTADGSPPVPRP